jgi:hypothetical protein
MSVHRTGSQAMPLGHAPPTARNGGLRLRVTHPPTVIEGEPRGDENMSQSYQTIRVKHIGFVFFVRWFLLALRCAGGGTCR